MSEEQKQAQKVVKNIKSILKDFNKKIAKFEDDYDDVVERIIKKLEAKKLKELKKK